MSITQGILSLAILASTTSGQFTVYNDNIALPPRITQEMRDMTSEDIKGLIGEVWGNKAHIGVAIAKCESGIRQFETNGMILRGRQVNQDIGIMQINSDYHEDTYLRVGIDVFTPEGNVTYGKYLYDSQGIQPWSASKKCWSKTLTSM